jgi:8-oxo-dGTP pyrophosphatase MutT (NUDIX family)
MTLEEATALINAVAEPRVVVSAWTSFVDGRMLVVRPHGVPVWFFAGGLVEAGESLGEAAAREAMEEVGVLIDAADLSTWTVVTAPAHGRPGTTAVIAVHIGPHTGPIKPLGEIAEVGWVTRANRSECADAIQLGIDQAVIDGLLSADG